MIKYNSSNVSLWHVDASQFKILNEVYVTNKGMCTVQHIDFEGSKVLKPKEQVEPEHAHCKTNQKNMFWRKVIQKYKVQSSWVYITTRQHYYFLTLVHHFMWKRLSFMVIQRVNLSVTSISSIIIHLRCLVVGKHHIPRIIGAIGVELGPVSIVLLTSIHLKELLACI